MNIALQALSSVNSESLSYCLKYMFPFLAGFSLYLVIISIPASDEDKERFVFFVVLAGFFVALYGILQYFGFEILQYQEEVKREKYNILSFLGHPNYVAAFLAPLAFIALSRYQASSLKWQKTFYITSAIGFVFCISLAGTRGAWLSMIFSAACILLFILVKQKAFGIKYSRMLAGALVFCVVIAAGFFFVKHKYDIGYRLGEKEPILGRFYCWMLAGDMFRSHPIIGIGAGNFESKFWDYAYEFQKREGNKVYEFMFINAKGSPPGLVHNEYIQFLAEHGLLGFISYLMIFLIAFDSARRRILHSLAEGDRIKAARFLGILGALLTLAADAQLNFTFHLPVSGMLFWFLLALLP